MNALHQAEKEISHRFDLKDSNSSIDYNEKENTLQFASSEEYKLTAVTDIFKNTLIKRNLSPKALSFEKVEPALGGTAKQTATIQNGIPQDKAKQMVKDIKSKKFKVQAQIQGEQIRVSAKKKDDLQAVMAFLRDQDYGIHMAFGNYR